MPRRIPASRLHAAHAAGLHFLHAHRRGPAERSTPPAPAAAASPPSAAPAEPAPPPDDAARSTYELTGTAEPHLGTFCYDGAADRAGTLLMAPFPPRYFGPDSTGYWTATLAGPASTEAYDAGNGFSTGSLSSGCVGTFTYDASPPR